MQRFLRNRQGLGFRGAREEAASEIAQLLATERPVDEVAQLLSESAAYRRYVDDLRSRFGRLGGALALGGASFAYSSPHLFERSDERRVGNEWGSTGRSRWSRYT